MSGRGDRFEAVLGERGLDRFLVTDLTNVRYLTGFTGTNGAAICGPGARVFLTDFRYTERAAAEVSEWEIVTVTGDWLAGIAERLVGKVGFEDDHVSVRTFSKLEEKLSEGVEAVAAGGTVEGLRRVKDETELARIAEATKLADAALKQTAENGLVARPSARSPITSRPRSAASAASSLSTRSSPPARTAPSRTRSPATG